MDWQALWLTARLAALVSAILLVVSLPLAHWIAFSRRRWTFLVESVVSLPLVLPPTVLGFYLLMAIGRAEPARPAVDRRGPGIRWRSRSKGWSSPRCSTACRSRCNRSPRRSPRWIRRCAKRPRPSARRGCARSCASCCRCRSKASSPVVVLSFAHTVGEFGVVLMVGGNLPGVTRTVSICRLRPRAGAAVPRGQPRRRSSCSPSRSRSCSIVYGLRRRPLAAAPMA